MKIFGRKKEPAEAAAAPQTPPKKKKKKNSSRAWMSDIYYGRTLSAEFFRSNAWFLIIFVAVVLALMGVRYDTKTKMKEIKQLNAELQRAESSKLQEKAAYMSLIRETEMKRLIEEKGLGLEFQETPPYTLELERSH